MIRLPRLFNFRRGLNPDEKKFWLRLKKQYKIKPKNIELYRIAVIHKSASTIISKGIKVNNERLEYLGDSILDAIVAEHLFNQFPNRSEGFLTKMRSRIVSRQSLNVIALAIGLDKLVVSHTNNPLAHKHIFGDALEAFVGAIYLDLGFEQTSKWVKDTLFSKHIDLEVIQKTETDYKSRVIELAQKHKVPIEFNSKESESNNPHIPQFESKIFLNQRLLGSGFGTSKKEAEQNAAMVALERIDIVPLPNQKIKPESLNWEN